MCEHHHLESVQPLYMHILFVVRFQTELPEVIDSRKEKFITKAELCKIMKWKLTVRAYTVYIYIWLLEVVTYHNNLLRIVEANILMNLVVINEYSHV